MERRKTPNRYLHNEFKEGKGREEKRREEKRRESRPSFAVGLLIELGDNLIEPQTIEGESEQIVLLNMEIQRVFSAVKAPIFGIGIKTEAVRCYQLTTIF